MELVVVGALCGLGFALSTLLWHLCVRPEVVLSLLDRHALSDDAPPPPDERSVRALRWAVGAMVVLTGFLTGAALAFLAATEG